MTRAELRPPIAPSSLAVATVPGRLWGAAAALWVVGYAAIESTAGVRGTYELWWETRQGQLTLQTGHAVLAHSWSWTAGDLTWIPNSWGWGVLLALAYGAAGLLGTVAFVLAVQIAFFGLAWWVLGLLGVAQRASRLALLVLLSVTMSGWASGRSELADYLCVFAFAGMCLLRPVGAVGPGTRTVMLGVGAVLLAAMWENLHLGGLVAVPMFVAVFLVCEFGSATVREDHALGRTGGRCVVIAGGAALGVLCTPSGFAGIAKSLVTASKSRAEHYAAWEALFAQPDSYNYEPVVLALGVGVGALLLVVARRRWLTATILALSLGAGCVVVRSGTDLVMLSLFAGARPAVELLSRAAARVDGRRARRVRRLLPVVSVWLAVVWATVAVVAGAGFALPLWRLTGVDPSDLNAIPARARVYSTVGASDAIALLRPDLQVTIDSRNDLYPVSLFSFARSLRQSHADRAPAWFAKNDVTATYLPGRSAAERRTPLALSLAGDGWKEYDVAHGLVLLSPNANQ